MKTDGIKDKKKKRVVATTPNMFYDPYASVQFITREAFEAAICKPPNIVKALLGSAKAVIPPSSNGSSIQIITREDYEDAVHKLPTSRTIGGLPWSRSFFLGEGSYGMVYRATNNGDVEGDHLPSEMANKCAPIASASSLINEEEILISLTSPYVVCCYGSKITMAKTRFGSDDHNLILEYCAGGSIDDFLKHQRGGMAEAKVQLFAKDILKGINYIHSKKIIHCDIKPGNILLKHVGHNSFEIKLADFGLAIEKKPDGYKESKGFKRGTLLYMSPELLRDGILDYGTDIWAYGCTILEMCTGKRPWSEMRLNDRQKLKEIISNSEINQEIPQWLSIDAKDFLEKCLEKDPRKRYDSNALLNHKFLTSINSVDVGNKETYDENPTSAKKNEA